jgi:hypothetical protein
MAFVGSGVPTFSTSSRQDQRSHEKDARSFLHRAGADFGDSVATACMVRVLGDKSCHLFKQFAI